MFDRLRRLLKVGLAAVCVSVTFLMPAAVLAEPEEGRSNRALLVGVDEFVSRQSTFPSSTNNVLAMREAFEASNEPFASVIVPSVPLTSAEALRSQIQAAFAQADENDVNYLYISTHGVFDAESGEPATLLLSDGKVEGRITAAELEACFRGIKGTKVILLDACYSGAFIGKGMRTQPEQVCFLGDDFKVLTSSGAMEESWYWNAAENSQITPVEGYHHQQGAFYFTQALSQSISARYGYYADANRDGKITLKELYNALLENHAASTPQVYPQEDSFVVFTYQVQNTTAYVDSRSPIGDVIFSNATLSAVDSRINLEFIALRPVRVAYQIVNQRDGVWRFEEAQLIYDDVEQFAAYGDQRGAIAPGRKVRTLSLNLQDGASSGYVMVQLVSIEKQKLTVHAGQVIAIPPQSGELGLAVEVAGSYYIGDPKELAIFVAHAYPCQLSVSIVGVNGETIRRLSHKQSTRPLRIVPEGSTFYWDGLDKSGNPVPEGEYSVRVVGAMGEQRTTIQSSPVMLIPSDG